MNEAREREDVVGALEGGIGERVWRRVAVMEEEAAAAAAIAARREFVVEEEEAALLRRRVMEMQEEAAEMQGGEEAVRPRDRQVFDERIQTVLDPAHPAAGDQQTGPAQIIPLRRVGLATIRNMFVRLREGADVGIPCTIIGEMLIAMVELWTQHHPGPTFSDGMSNRTALMNWFMCVLPVVDRPPWFDWLQETRIRAARALRSVSTGNMLIQLTGVPELPRLLQGQTPWLMGETMIRLLHDFDPTVTPLYYTLTQEGRFTHKVVVPRVWPAGALFLLAGLRIVGGPDSTPDDLQWYEATPEELVARTNLSRNRVTAMPVADNIRNGGAGLPRPAGGFHFDPPPDQEEEEGSSTDSSSSTMDIVVGEEEDLANYQIPPAREDGPEDLFDNNSDGDYGDSDDMEEESSGSSFHLNSD